MDYRLKTQLLIAKARALVDESRNLVRTSSELRTMAKSRMSNQKLRVMERRSDRPVRDRRGDRDELKRAV